MSVTPDRVPLPVAVERVASRILTLRGERVLLDADLARLYEVPVKRLNEAVKRNPGRFPQDFMFQLTDAEWAALRSQIATSKSPGRGGRRHMPYAFTEHGAIMVATLLRSRRAVAMSIFVVRAFVRLRGAVLAHGDLVQRIDALERKYDGQFRVVFEAIREALESTRDDGSRRRIGFSYDLDDGGR